MIKKFNEYIKENFEKLDDNTYHDIRIGYMPTIYYNKLSSAINDKYGNIYTINYEKNKSIDIIFYNNLSISIHYIDDDYFLIEYEWNEDDDDFIAYKCDQIDSIISCIEYIIKKYLD